MWSITNRPPPSHPQVGVLPDEVLRERVAKVVLNKIKVSEAQLCYRNYTRCMSFLMDDFLEFVASTGKSSPANMASGSAITYDMDNDS